MLNQNMFRLEELLIKASTSGMLADMGAQRWTTLWVIASSLENDGKCRLNHVQIAKLLGVNPSTAGSYVRSLMNYRWHGNPIITAVRERENGRWTAPAYELLPTII